MKLAEVCRIVGGGTPSKKNKAYYSGNIPWASVRDMNNPILTSTEFRISDEAVRESATNVIPAGEVIISTHVGLGKVCILAQDTAINQDLKAVIPTVDIDRRYLYHWFVSQAPKLVAAGKGATVKGVTVKFVLDLDIPIPSRNSQQSIAKQLSLVLECVKKRQAQLARLDALAKSLFVEMFGDKEWPTVPTSYVLHELRNGVSPSTTGSYRDKVLTLSAITRGRFDPTFWKEGMFHESPGNDYRISTSDFYIVRGNGNRSLVGLGEYSKEDHHDLVFPDTIIAGRVNNEAITLPFLREVWRLPATRRQIEQAARSTNGTYKINQKAVVSTSIPLPPLPLQRAFAARLEAIDKSKFAIRKSLDELNRLYRSLLQQYFG